MGSNTRKIKKNQHLLPLGWKGKEDPIPATTRLDKKQKDQSKRTWPWVLPKGVKLRDIGKGVAQGDQTKRHGQGRCPRGSN